MTVKFDNEKLARVSDFYKNPDGSLQDKEGRFQIMFQGNDYLHPVKLCTAFLNMAIFVNRPPQKVQLKLSGDAHILKFEIQLVESTKEEKIGGDDSDVEETDEQKSKHERNMQSVETTELPPNSDLERRNHELERLYAGENQRGQQLRSEIDQLERKASELQMK